MSDARLRTVLLGLGKIGAGYADDPVMARYFPFATHAQVLAQHPGFKWDACVDPSSTARAAARQRWGVDHVVEKIDALPRGYRPDVVVVASPPEARADLIEAFDARAFVLEKPLARSAAEGRALVARCRARGALVQVCLWRRADAGLRALATGELTHRVGEIQFMNVVYGNGLRNNGTHMIDMVRMLAGEVAEVQAIPATSRAAGPLQGDIDVAFYLRLVNGAFAVFAPIDFRNYRENGLDIWGGTGRISIMQEGLVARAYHRKPNRAMQGEWEIDGDDGSPLVTDPGRALYHLYDNLAAALAGKDEVWSSGASAVHTESVVEAVFASLEQGGRRTHIS